MKSSSSYRRKLAVAFAGILGVMLLADVATYRVTTELINAADMRSRAHRVLENLDTLLIELINAETGQRGYLLTGDPKYLQPYQAAVKQVGQTILKLRDRVRDDPGQERRLDKMQPLVAAKIEELRQTIGLRTGKGFTAAQQVVLSGEGKQLMDSIRGVAARMADREEDIINRRYNLAKVDAQRTTRAMLTANLLSYVALILVFILATREIQQRQRTEEKLLESQAELENRVKERTAELARANEQLRVELAERQRAQEVERETQTRFRFLFANNPLPMWIYDLETLRFLEVNDAAVAHYGYSREEFAAMRITDIRPEEDVPLLLDSAASRGPGLQRSGEWRHRLKDGRIIDVEIISHHLDWVGRKAILVVAQDITERKLAERALRQTKAMFEKLFESSPDAIITTRLEGQIVRVNTQAERVFGYSRDELTGQPVEVLIPERFREIHPAHRRKYQAEPRTRAMGAGLELQGLRKDGTEFPVEVALSHMETGGGWRAISVIRDITERRQAEEELKRAKESAEAGSRAKSEFLANMSHEIRTPINGILGMTELALDTEMTPEQREYLEMAKSSADSLLILINDILDFSKIEARKLQLETIQFGLRDCVEETTKVLALRAHQKGLELVCHISPDVPDTGMGDPGRLRQVLVNLVGNAIKFTEHGEIVVRLEKDSETKQDVVLHFAVSDTGIGIPAAKQQVIFEAFSQVDGSMTRRYGGTGLGLTIASQLVQMMGGRLSLESKVGKGSTFHFHARLGLPKEPVVRPQAVSFASLRGLPVLVVDDNATNRRILQEMLNGWRMQPTLAENGPAALALLHRARQSGQHFTLALIDVHMPAMDGFTLAEEIRRTPELAGATIMMLTSAGQCGDAARCRELGVAAYLSKPIRQSDLLEAILRVLGANTQDAGRTELVTRHSLREKRKGLRILLAEDNAVNRQLARRLLEKHGHTVALAENGREALEALEQQSFHLVLMDVQMPEMDGLEATAAIRQKEKATGQHIPIIAMTAHAMKGDRERCLAAGMDGYVSKPIQTAELFETIEALASPLEKIESPGTTK